jgi:hypothetical protein
LPRGADAVGPGNPDWSSCRRADGPGRRTAGRWVAPPAVAAVRFKRPTGRRTRLSRARLGKAVGVPRALMTLTGPIGREQAGSPAIKGFLGVVLLKLGPSSRSAHARTGHQPRRHPPSSIRRTGPRRSPLLLVRATPPVRAVGRQLGSQCCPSYRRFRSFAGRGCRRAQRSPPEDRPIACPSSKRSPSLWAWRSEAALALAALDDPDRARKLAAEELRLVRELQVPRTLGVALRAAGLVAGGAEGLAMLQEAVAALAGSGRRRARPRADRSGVCAASRRRAAAAA